MKTTYAHMRSIEKMSHTDWIESKAWKLCKMYPAQCSMDVPDNLTPEEIQDLLAELKKQETPCDFHYTKAAFNVI